MMTDKALKDGWINTAGRKPGKTPRVKVRDELPNAINQVVEASANGDVNASVAVVNIALSYGDKLTIKHPEYR